MERRWRGEEREEAGKRRGEKERHGCKERDGKGKGWVQIRGCREEEEEERGPERELRTKNNK